jgi:hypothetical protein
MPADPSTQNHMAQTVTCRRQDALPASLLRMPACRSWQITVRLDDLSPRARSASVLWQIGHRSSDLARHAGRDTARRLATRPQVGSPGSPLDGYEIVELAGAQPDVPLGGGTP